MKAMKDRELADIYMPRNVSRNDFPKEDRRLPKKGSNVSHLADSLLTDIVNLVNQKRKEKKPAKPMIILLKEVTSKVKTLTDEVTNLKEELSMLKVSVQENTDYIDEKEKFIQELHDVID